jgi:hypothetical protein
MLSKFTKVFTVDNIVDARYKIEALENEGYDNKKRTEYIAKHI